jgi:hypothetical protein
MPVSSERERVIRDAWKERGTAQWDPQVHGIGIEPLNIQAATDMRAQKPGHPPIPPYDNLEFRLERITIDGEAMNSIVCEGVVVETWPVRSE